MELTFPIGKNLVYTPIISFYNDTLSQTANIEDENTNLKRNNIVRAKANVDTIFKQLSGWVYSIVIPDKWRKENILPPTCSSKALAEKITKSIYQKYELIPQNISASIEQGVFVNYRNFKNNKKLSIEIYNDMEIAAILNREKQILKVMDIIDESFEEIIELFKQE